MWFFNDKNVFKGDRAIFDFINPENYYTPLVEIDGTINRFKKYGVNIFAKISWFNPLLNIKLIPAYWMFKKAKEKGKLKEVTNLIEASSGNMAYSLKILSSYFGIKKFIALISSNVSSGKKRLLDLLGIDYKIREEDICPDPNDPKSSINIAKKFRDKKGWYNLGQYDNEDNFYGHYNLTGKQIYEQLAGDIDIVSIGLGTTGTLIGISKYLKERLKDVIIVGVIRHKNNLVPGVRTLNLLKEINFNWEDYLDHKILIDSKRSYYYSLLLIRKGLFCGPSSGFALAGLIEFIKNNRERIKNLIDKKGYVNCVFVCPDTFLPYAQEYFDVLRINDEITAVTEKQQEAKEHQKGDMSILGEELNKILTSNEQDRVIVIDIRNEPRFKDVHIRDSINIPYDKLIKKPEIILKFVNKKIIIVCDYDVKSEMLVTYLKSSYPDLDIYYLKGGISEWSIKNYPRKGNICFEINRQNNK